MPRKLCIGLTAALSIFLLSPFLTSIGMGVIFAVLFYPWMKRIEKGRFPNALAAGLFTLAVTLLIFLPVSALVIAGAKSGMTELKHIKRMSPGPTGPSSSEEVLDKLFVSSGFERFLQRTAKVLPMDPAQVSDQLKELVATSAARLGDALSAFVGQVPSMIVAFSIFLFSLYYFLADGLRFLGVIRQASPFNTQETKRLYGAFSGLCRSVILASVISGGIQALAATAISLAVGIQPFLIVFLTVFIASFVPVIGSLPVVLSLSVYQFLEGHAGAGAVLAVSSVVIASLDHFIRPQVIRGSSNLHPLLAFLSALGGLEIFGIAGIFLGPVLLGLSIEVLAIAQEARVA